MRRNADEIHQRRWLDYRVAGQNSVTFNHRGKDISMNLREMLKHEQDYITFHIVASQTFYEVNLLDHIADNHPKHKTIIEVGANIGNHTKFFESFLEYDKLVCFEPDVGNYALLLSNIQNSKTAAARYAIGSEEKMVGLTPTAADNCGSFKVCGGSHVHMITLDQTFISDVTMIKIDVEGFELDVLRGGIETIIKNKPLLYLEISEREYEIRALLSSLGYVQTNAFEYDDIQTHEFMHLTAAYPSLRRS